MSKSTGSRISADIDRGIAPVRQRPLGLTAFPYVFLDATYVKARVDHQVESRAVVIATGVTAEENVRSSVLTSGNPRTSSSGPASARA